MPSSNDHPSKIFLPLRSGVELFTDPQLPTAVTRAKQAAVLYDEVIVEAGLCEVQVTTGFSTDDWVSPNNLDDEELAASRRIITPGEELILSVGFEGSDETYVIGEGPVSLEYFSEYHTGILDDLVTFDPDWLTTVSGAALQPGFAGYRHFKELEKADKSDPNLLSSHRTKNLMSQRNWIIKAFDRDLVMASQYGAAFNTTSLFTPMLRAREIRSARTGHDALELFVPNIGELPWVDVLAFRDHPASSEARAKLREFEAKAAYAEPADAKSYMRSVEREVREALLTTVEELRPNWTKKLTAEILNSTIGVIPVVGKFSGPLLEAAGVGSDYVRDRRSWTSALMVLRSGSQDTR